MTVDIQKYLYVTPSAMIGEHPTTQEFRTQFEKGTEEDKIQAMKNLLVLMANGDPHSDLLMHVIRFVMPTPKNKTIKKLLLLYFELCEKYGPDGKLKQEMILVCNALRNDLQHPNEYVRAATLRLVSKLQEPELLDPLIPSIRACLEHRHYNVRRQSLLAIAAIYHSFPTMFPDAPELLASFISKESDPNCLSMAIIVLSRISRPLFIAYLQDQYKKLANLEEPIQLAILDAIHQDSSNEDNSFYLHIIATLSLSPTSSIIQYSCAFLFSLLSDLPRTHKQAIQIYLSLVSKESNNSIRLVVLDRISDLYKQHSIDGFFLELLSVCAPTSDISVTQRALEIIISHSTPSSLPDVIEHLRKDLERTMDDTSDHVEEYRKLILSSIPRLLHPSVPSNVVLSFLQTISTFLLDRNVSYVLDCVQVFRSIASKYRSALGNTISELLCSKLSMIKSARVYRPCIWMIGEYSTDLSSVIQHIRQQIDSVDTQEDSPEAIGASNENKVLPDGTYATQTAITSTTDNIKKQQRHIFYEQGHAYTPASIAMMLTKLLFRHYDDTLAAQAMLIIVRMLRLLKDSPFQGRLSTDSLERMVTCFHWISNIKNMPKDLFDYQYEEEQKTEIQEKTNGDVDAPLVPQSFLLDQENKATTRDKEDPDIKALIAEARKDNAALISRLDRVFPLTGLSDLIFAEAYIDMDGLDVIVDMILVNQGQETLRNICVEFVSSGGSRMVFKPSQGTLGGYGFTSLKAVIHIQNAEQGIWQGCISYDAHAISLPSYQVLNVISLDSSQFLVGEGCTDAQYAEDWRVLEWENRINIRPRQGSFLEAINDLCSWTNFKCICPRVEDLGEADKCAVFSANLFARSKFGDQVLANVSLEKVNERLSGHVRIRCKSNGLARMIGNMISDKMG